MCRWAGGRAAREVADSTCLRKPLTAWFRAGIKVERVLFILSGVLATLAGWLLAARTNGATPNPGPGRLIEAFAAVVIGGASLRDGVGRLSGVLLFLINTAIDVMAIDL